MKVNNKERLIWGVGINDKNTPVSTNGKKDKCYTTWYSMLERCYSPRWKSLYPTYKNCTVCEDWKTYSQFEKWFNENYIVGYDLDKDLFSEGEPIYSPSTCTFLPPEINKLIHKAKRGNGLKLGVSMAWGKYKSSINAGGYTRHLGLFDSEDEAHEAYVKARLKHIARVADYYYNKKEISRRVYEALLNIQISTY